MLFYQRSDFYRVILGCNISSTEKHVNICTGKAQTTISCTIRAKIKKRRCYVTHSNYENPFMFCIGTPDKMVVISLFVVI